MFSLGRLALGYYGVRRLNTTDNVYNFFNPTTEVGSQTLSLPPKCVCGSDGFFGGDKYTS